MSYAREHPVHCARQDDLGCTASYPGSRFDAMKAVREGWFLSRAEEQSYCPGHLPDWVPAWRARQAALKFEVAATVAVQPSVLKCSGCDLAEETSPDPDEETVRALRAQAFEHGRRTGHPVTVTTARTLIVEPAS